MFDLGGTTSLTLWEMEGGGRVDGPDGARPFPIFSVADARETRGVLQDRRVAVGDVLDGGGVTYFTFRDPDGNLLEACKVHRENP